MRKDLTVIISFLVLFSLVLGASKITFASSLSPQWTTLTTEQKRFLLEAFSINESEQKTLWDPLPEVMKQFVIDSMWKSITPEKQQQILIYAHIDKPFSKASDTASKIPAPKWNSLSTRQQNMMIQAFNFDETQLSIWNNLPVEIKQLYIDALWPYIATEQKNMILGGSSNKVNPQGTPPQDTGYTGPGNPNTNPYNPPTNTYPTYNASVTAGPKWASLNTGQQQAMMVAFNFDSTQGVIWTYLTPEMKQMFIDYVWQYFGEDMKQEIMAGNVAKVQEIKAEEAGSVLPPPQWITLDPEEQGKLVVAMKLDPTLWGLLPPEGKQFFLNTVWRYIPLAKQKEIMDAI
ncbi:MAG TPA: hypothetical protein PL110_14800 [Candidatus Eremiobacteraeota bacterium]|nr:hypothetical protein [Candidatus Eremiobacteraeota bacterium]